MELVSTFDEGGAVCVAVRREAGQDSKGRPAYVERITRVPVAELSGLSDEEAKAKLIAATVEEEPAPARRVLPEITTADLTAAEAAKVG